jgi:hypothetical protein
VERRYLEKRRVNAEGGGGVFLEEEQMQNENATVSVAGTRKKKCSVKIIWSPYKLTEKMMERKS